MIKITYHFFSKLMLYCTLSQLLTLIIKKVYYFEAVLLVCQ